MPIAVLALTLAALLVAPEPSPPQDEAAAIILDPFDLDAEDDEVAREPEAEQTGEAEAAAPTAPPSPKRLMCRSRPELGTRLRSLRVCMTAQEWEMHEHHMEQQRRDINEWGAQGQAGPQ